MVLLGDFNYPCIEWIDGSGFSNLGSDIRFIDIIQDFSYLQLVNSPTRDANLLDLILTTNEHIVSNIVVNENNSFSLHSDHRAITFDLKLRLHPKQSSERIVYNYSKADFEGLTNSLREYSIS